jgi:hypothetical protein
MSKTNSFTIPVEEFTREKRDDVLKKLYAEHYPESKKHNYKHYSFCAVDDYAFDKCNAICGYDYWSDGFRSCVNCNEMYYCTHCEKTYCDKHIYRTETGKRSCGGNKALHRKK